MMDIDVRAIGVSFIASFLWFFFYGGYTVFVREKSVFDGVVPVAPMMIVLAIGAVDLMVSLAIGRLP